MSDKYVGQPCKNCGHLYWPWDPCCNNFKPSSLIDYAAKAYKEGIKDCFEYLNVIAVNQRLNNGEGSDIIKGKDLEQLAYEMRCNFDKDFK